jgi:hypothetical protein
VCRDDQCHRTCGDSRADTVVDIDADSYCDTHRDRDGVVHPDTHAAVAGRHQL